MFSFGLKDRQIQRNVTSFHRSIHSFTPSSPTTASMGQAYARNQRLSAHLTQVWQGPEHWSHHLLPPRVPRTKQVVKAEAKLGLKPGHNHMGNRCPIPRLDHCTQCPACLEERCLILNIFKSTVELIWRVQIQILESCHTDSLLPGLNNSHAWRISAPSNNLLGHATMLT